MKLEPPLPDQMCERLWTLPARVDSAIAQTRDYGSTNDATSIGQHIAFLRESAKIIQAAPIFGHGTGSIHEQFGLVTAGVVHNTAAPTRPSWIATAKV